MAMHKAVVGLAATNLQADAIVESLQTAGFIGSDISVLFPDKTGVRGLGHEQNTKAPEGAVAGVGAGGAVGGALGLLAGIGLIAIPGLGPFIAAGPILAAFSGAAAGAAVGGITGALIGMGIPEIEARQFEGKVRSGSILVSVHVESATERDRAKNVLERHGATDVVTIGEERAAA